MKRLLLVLLILIPVVLLGVWLANKPMPPWNVKTTMTFLGFTNAVAGAPNTNVLLGFNTIPSDNTSWMVASLGQFDGTTWNFNGTRSYIPFLFFQPGGNFHAGDTNFYLRGIVPLGSTSAPTRVVICLEKRPTGKVQEFLASAGDFVARVIGGKNPPRPNGRRPVFLMTNDFNFTSSTPPPP